MNTCDIIIPTYNGQEKLSYTLEALLAQDIPSGWTVRVIVSDDGSHEPIADIDKTYAWVHPWLSLSIIRSSHTGRSHARNIAIDYATGDILLFLADDILLRPGALREHLIFHETNNTNNMAALGCVAWDPRIHPTPFMDWMMHGGQQNDYDAILGAHTANAGHYFYGSFVSMKRMFLEDNRFSEQFSAYGWEDLELGECLHTKGLVLHVLPNAISLHRHRYTASAILERQRIVGSAKYRVNTNATRRVIHGLYVAIGARAVSLYFIKKWGDKVNFPRFFALVTAGEFWYGVHHANSLLKSELQ
ncbi:MAG TPA: glycosyltransferase [Candidatus Andersenbacteria bacterium]|nr:glycosyltransferase [Candidatus Andersenbacteria bacterium]